MDQRSVTYTDRLDTDAMVLGHIRLIEEGLEQLRRGIDAAQPLPGTDGIIIHKDSVLNMVQFLANGVWAVHDLIENRDSDDILNEYGYTRCCHRCVS